MAQKCIFRTSWHFSLVLSTNFSLLFEFGEKLLHWLWQIHTTGVSHQHVTQCCHFLLLTVFPWKIRYWFLSKCQNNVFAIFLRSKQIPNDILQRRSQCYGWIRNVNGIGKSSSIIYRPRYVFGACCLSIYILLLCLLCIPRLLWLRGFINEAQVQIFTSILEKVL